MSKGEESGKKVVYCRHCKGIVAKDASFCVHCGSKSPVLSGKDLQKQQKLLAKILWVIFGFVAVITFFTSLFCEGCRN